ncbi:hypothetical protein SNE40_018180 [Patella caerulea]
MLMASKQSGQKLRLNTGNCLISSFYRKPNSPVAHWAAVEESFSFAKEDNKHCIILGYFNYDTLRYPTGKIFDLANKLNLQQLIASPTRITPYSSSLLDLCLVSCPDHIVSSNVLDAGLSDHCPIEIEICREKPHDHAYSRTIWNYESMDIENINRFYNNFNWNQLYVEKDVLPNVLVNNISNIISKGIDLYVPHKKTTVRPQDSPWMNGYIRRIIRKRNRLHKKAERSNLPEDWAKFRNQRYHVTAEVRRVKTEF